MLIHHIVVLEQTLADTEVVRLDLLLGVLDGLRDHTGLDRFALGNLEALHDGSDALTTEKSHQVVFQRDEELRRAGVALATCAATQLAVDTAGLMTFRTDDDETAIGLHLGVKLNVRTATGHVRGDGHCSLAAG